MTNIWPIHLTHGAVQIIVVLLFIMLWYIRYKKYELYQKHKSKFLFLNLLIIYVIPLIYLLFAVMVGVAWYIVALDPLQRKMQSSGLDPS